MNLENSMLNKTDTKRQTSYDSTYTRYQEKANSQSIIKELGMGGSGLEDGRL